MVLDYEYGINTGNRFLNLVDHDEDPDEFIANQTQPEEKTKKPTKDAKAVTSASSKKATTKPTTTTASTSNVSSTTKTNKENLTGKPTNTNQRKLQSNILGDNNNQQPPRGDSARGGGGRGFSRRGGSAGQDRPPYEGGNRGGGQQRTQRFNKYEGQQTSNETSGFEQAGDSWGNEPSNDNNNQSYGTGYRGRGRGGPRRGNFEGGRGNFEGGRGHFEGGRGHFEGGRGNFEGGRGNFEGGRGGGRGRGRGGRGYFNNRNNFEDASQEQQRPQTQETNEWQQNTDSNFDNTRPQTAGQDADVDVSGQERPFEPDNTRRGGRGHYRARTFHNNRGYGGDRSHQYEREGGEVSQGEYRHNRRQHDRQPRNNVSGVKSVEKKEGEGAHNWGSPTENPEENPVSEEINETTAQTAGAPKAWAQQMDEFEKQMTLDEYKKQIEAKKQATLEKLPQFNRRVAGEGVDPKDWQKFQHLYIKKNDDDEGGDDEEEGSAGEENESGEEAEEEQVSGKKKIITIPLRFKPIDIPRGPAGSRGGPRRGGAGGGRYRDQPRPKSPSEQQQTPSYQQPGEYQNDEQPQQQQQQQQYQQRPYRGGSRPGRGEYRRSYGNSARGPRGSYNRSNVDSNTPDFDNALDFPTLPKQ